MVRADKLPDVGETALPGLLPCRQAEWPCSDCAVVTSCAREGVGMHFRGPGKGENLTLYSLACGYFALDSS